ncbi:conserved hypothetical protein [Ricinus communis]|uniref:Uncharacterized protein n=1 Tax=Ricinus communis TaxID=3988 RepID=B9TMT1_RICCO|nr:conserved hypothetical protein [Ricinus communis]
MPASSAMRCPAFTSLKCCATTKRPSTSLSTTSRGASGSASIRTISAIASPRATASPGCFRYTTMPVDGALTCETPSRG